MLTNLSPSLNSDSIFISYSRQDWESHVRPLVERLRAAGLRVWVDQHLLQGGQDWMDEINHALDVCGRMILCLSPDALESKYVRMEYRYFIEENKPIIPVMCRETRLLAELRGLQWIPYDLDQLLALLGESSSVGNQPTDIIHSVASTTTRRSVITSSNAPSTREIMALHAHDKPIMTVDFSPDGALLASASSDGTIKLWDPLSYRELATLPNRDPVYDIAFSPDSKTIASAIGTRFGNSSSVTVWDCATYRPTASFAHHSAKIYEIVYSPDGSRIACACWDHTVTIWDAREQQQTAVLSGHTGTVSSVSFSPDGKRLVSSSWDGTIKLWDVETHEVIAALEGHKDQVNDVIFSPNGTLIASVSADETVRLWDAATFEPLVAFEQGSPVWRCAFSPDSRVLASGSMTGAIKLWCVEDRTDLATLVGHAKPVLSLAFSPDGTIMASGARDGAIKLWTAV